MGGRLMPKSLAGSSRNTQVGFEISNDRFEVIAELEFAWPELRLGIYTDVLQEQIEGWTLYSVAAVKADLSLISRLIAASA